MATIVKDDGGKFQGMVGNSMHYVECCVKSVAENDRERGQGKANKKRRKAGRTRIFRIKDTCAFQLQRVSPRCPSTFRLPISPAGTAASNSRSSTKTTDLKDSQENGKNEKHRSLGA